MGKPLRPPAGEHTGEKVTRVEASAEWPSGYRVALWGPSTDHPAGIAWGAPTALFAAEIEEQERRLGRPLRIVEVVRPRAKETRSP